MAVLLGTGVAQIRSGAAPQDTSPGRDVVIRSSVREVLLDVVVRDAHGRLAGNLKPEQVTVYEDGVRQNLRSFRLVAGSEVRAEDQREAAETPPAAAPASAPGDAAAQPPARALNPLRTVNIVCLVLNDLNPETRAFAFDAARKFVNNELRPNTFIGVFSLDASGLRPVFPFSNNRANLLKAVELAAVNQLPALNLDSSALLNGLSMSAFGGISASPADDGSGGNADGSSVADPLGTRGDMGFSVIAGLREIDALLKLVRQLGPLPFQKTVLLLSTGMTRPPDQLEYWNSLIQSARDARVTFYAMDVYGLGVCQGDTNPDCSAHSAMQPSIDMLRHTARLSASQANAGRGRQPGSAGQMMEQAHQDDFLKYGVLSANRQEALREIAESTGGFLIANTNNTDKLLARVMEDVDTHYELSYEPARASYDGHFRKIEVRLARPGLQVQTRSGYFALPENGEGPVTPAEIAGLRALDANPPPNAFDFQARVYRFPLAGGGARDAIAFEMPISNLTATAQETGNKHRLHASLLALVRDARGEVVERVSRDVPSLVSDEHLAEIRAELMTYEHAVNLPPGRYTVSAAVVDQEGNRASTRVLEIDNPQPRGPGLSDIALVRRLENLDRQPDAADPFEFTGKRVLPFVTTHLVEGMYPLAYFAVYPERGSAAKVQLRMQFLKDGRLLAARNPELASPDAAGRIPMLIVAPGTPGNYEIRVTVAQGAATIERSLTYSVVGR